MALIKCPECGKEVSDRSTQCIHCGYPLIDNKAEFNASVSATTQSDGVITPVELNSSAKEISPIKESDDMPEPSVSDSTISHNATTSETTIKSKKPVIIALVSIIAVIGIGCGVYFGTANMRRYNQATELQQRGAYEEAVLAYSEVIDYQDAATNMNECKYAIAENYQAEGAYDEAILMYEEIADYSDSATRISECKYAIAADLQAKGNYTTAIEKYSEIQDFNDATVQICACNYELGMIEYNKEQYVNALEFFDLAKGFDNSEDMIMSCKYIIAVDLMNTRAFEDAITYFEQVPNYEDAAALQKKCEYNLTVDGQFILALSDALNSRWDATAATSDEEQSDLVAYRRDIIQLEYEYLEPFKELVFNDEDLGTKASYYIWYLEESNTALDYYTVDYTTFITRWEDAYNGRTLLIRYFAENFELQISEENQSVLDEFIAGANALDEQAAVEEEIITMLESAKATLSLESNDYGFRTYSVKVTNTTEKTFAYFDVQAKVYKDGVIYETLYGGAITDFAPGQTARFEFYTDYALDYYDLSADFSY